RGDCRCAGTGARRPPGRLAFSGEIERDTETEGDWQPGQQAARRSLGKRPGAAASDEGGDERADVATPGKRRRTVRSPALGRPRPDAPLYATPPRHHATPRVNTPRGCMLHEPSASGRGLGTCC